MTDAELMELARAAAAKAYSPYSQIQVGCALVATSGTIYSGCNVENASYGLTICAERAAIFAGVAAEGRGFRIARLAVIALGLEFPPCGACRQVMAEFCAAEMRVIYIKDKALIATTVGELLPAGFHL